MSQSTSSLLAELDAEFGKKPKKRLSTAQAADRIKNTTIFDRSATGTVSDLIAEANAYVRSWREVPGYEAIRRVTRIHNQKCRCCNLVTSYVANEFTEFESKRLKAKVQSAEAVFEDSLGFPIPHEVDEYSFEVEQGACCIRLSRKAEDLIALCSELVERQNLQLNLWEHANGGTSKVG
jgi:hypothetical protein